jgi:hypothetical protein
MEFKFDAQKSGEDGLVIKVIDVMKAMNVKAAGFVQHDC